MSTPVLGCLVWVVLFVLSRWAKRRLASREVSRNKRARETGPKWVQDVPIPIEELDQEDDL